jgi:large subunit ribosomal protein L10
MPTEKKEASIKAMREKLAGSKDLFFTDFRGLTVGELKTLRNALRKDSTSYSVIKNTLFAIAIGEERRTQLKTVLEGPTAVAFVGADPVAAAKALVKFAADSKKLQVKAAFVDGQFLSAEDVQALSKIRGRHELLTALVGSLHSPLHGLVNVLHGSHRKLVYVLHAIHQKKSETETPASETPAA